MTCAVCHRDANDHAFAYYYVSRGMLWKCWPCLTPQEKTALDPITRRARRFKFNKTIREIMP